MAIGWLYLYSRHRRNKRRTEELDDEFEEMNVICDHGSAAVAALPVIDVECDVSHAGVETEVAVQHLHEEVLRGALELVVRRHAVDVAQGQDQEPGDRSGFDLF